MIEKDETCPLYDDDEDCDTKISSCDLPFSLQGFMWIRGLEGSISNNFIEY